ncbi:MAG: acyl-CoA dehydrogenase family protein [Stackebrandtia sp.]
MPEQGTLTPEGPKVADADGYPVRVEAALATLPAEPSARHVWRALGHAGLLAELYPVPGAERAYPPDPARLRTLLAALDADLDIGAVLSVCVQAASATPILLEGWDSPPVRRAAEAALAGEAVTALGATDAGASGSDLLNLATEVRIDDDGLVLDGGKRWITSACFADQVLVLARHRQGAHFTNFTWVLAPTAAPGVTTTPADTPYFRGSGVGHLDFRDVRLGRDHVVGRVGRGLPSFTRNVGAERLAGAMWAAATARRVLRDTYRRLRDRGVGGEPLWRNAAVRERFGRCLLRYEQLTSLCAPHVARGSGVAPLSGMFLKAAAGETLEYILSECARLSGADGFAAGGVAHLRAEAAMFGIAGGAGEVMLAGIAEHVETVLDMEPS